MRQGSAGEKNLIDALAFHEAGVVKGDCAAAAAEDCNIAGAGAAQLSNDLGKEIDMAAVITRDADGADVLLDGGAQMSPA